MFVFGEDTSKTLRVFPSANCERDVVYGRLLATEYIKSCGDLGINRKNSQPDIDSSAARYKMYKCVATHKAPRIHPVKIRKRKIIKCKVANEKRSRQN